MFKPARSANLVRKILKGRQLLCKFGVAYTSSTLPYLYTLSHVILHVMVMIWFTKPDA